MSKISEAQRQQRSRAGSAKTPAKRRALALSNLKCFELRRLAKLLREDPAAVEHPTIASGLRELWAALDESYGSHSGYEVPR